MTTSVLDRIAAGDSNAVADCIDRFGGLVWSIARRLSASTTDAEDAVQEIFTEIWKKAARFDSSKSSEKTFIAMIARRRAIDRLRYKNRRPEELQAFDNPDLDPAGDQHREIEMSAEASIAARHLATLKPEQRQVIQMSVYYGMSHSEIASATNIPVGTVKSHIFRGLAAVRESMASASPEVAS